MAKLRTPENAERICELIAEGYTLRQVARDIEASASKISEWAREDAVFGEQYARAMEARWDRMAEEIQEISDEGTNDWMQRELDAGEIVSVPDHEHIQRSKLRVDTRKWLLAKMRPRQFGDRVTMAGDPEAPLNVAMTIEDKRAAAKALLEETFGPREEKPE